MKSLTNYVKDNKSSLISLKDNKSSLISLKDNKSSLISLKDNKSSLISLSEKPIINQRFDEKLIINKNYKNQYTYAPTSFNELRKIIEDRYDKLGPGTEKNPIDFNDVDVSNIDSFYDKNKVKGIFEKTKFEYIDISGLDVSKVKDMSCMFYWCGQLKSVGDLSDWNVSNVKNMSAMFCGCEQLKSVGDLSNWDVSKVKDMSYMFFNCNIEDKYKPKDIK